MSLDLDEENYWGTIIGELIRSAGPEPEYFYNYEPGSNLNFNIEDTQVISFTFFWQYRGCLSEMCGNGIIVDDINIQVQCTGRGSNVLSNCQPCKGPDWSFIAMRVPETVLTD